jgi:hypothetical protein
MRQTSRERVRRALTFRYPDRIPRDLGLLPWAEIRFPDVVRKIREQYPGDLEISGYLYPASPRIQGDPYRAGEYTDEWGCVFRNLQDGIIGEVKDPMIQDLDDVDAVQPPYEQLPVNPEKAHTRIARLYEKTERFVLANACPRVWERYQFLRGTENALVDMIRIDARVSRLLKRIHEFYLREMEFWADSVVDAVMFMDDWGGQQQLLIPPDLWRRVFKPMYKEYCDLAHAHGKFVFMHSDGYIQDIYPDLVEIGVDAINSQLFCMDMAKLARTVKGKVTFWGEIDRQHVLPSTDPEKGWEAVRKVAEFLYDPAGGIIAQFEFGPGANPQTVLGIFEAWEKVEKEHRQTGD